MEVIPSNRLVITGVSTTRDFAIPPGDPNYEVIGKPFVFAEDSHQRVAGARATGHQ